MPELKHVKIGWEVYYKPENRKYKVTDISKSFGKKYAHLAPVDGQGKIMKVVLPLREDYFSVPDNVNDLLAEF